MYLPYLPETPERREPVVLGIESSCDETAAAVVRGRHILSDEIASSADTQSLFGGVVPEIASRAHTEAISAVVRRAVGKSGVGFDGIDAVAVTYGAGLLGALLVGVSFAKALAYALNKPLIAVDHIRGHLAAAYTCAPDLEPPFVTLLASGGHTAVLYAETEGKFEILGATLDDAAGEAFDKAARTMGFPYPGGVYIDKASKLGNPDAFKLPRPHVAGSPYDFSFSGLKTAVINIVHNAHQKGKKVSVNDLSASFQAAVCDIISEKLMAALAETGHKKLVLAGGVSANSGLRARLEADCEERGVQFYCPPLALCGDNAAMVGSQGYYEFLAGNIAGSDLNAVASKKIDIE